MDSQHRAQLAVIYITQVGEESKSGKTTGISTSRLKLLRFLEEATDLDVRSLLPKVEALNLHEERVVLCSSEQQHQEALRILVQVLNDLPRAEVYCRVAMVRRQPRAAGTTAGSVSLFSSDLPTWARGTVFTLEQKSNAGGAKASPAAGSTSSPDVRGDSTQDDADRVLLGLSSAGAAPDARPLMFLLNVLIDASVGAAERPTEYPKTSSEYTEAALAFLMGYAGHPDLPPHEIIGLIPEGWALASLAGYFTKCARICLHERRASMLEENLSSMAYLKTFNAWAKERMRKVSITGDRCCPACNRRFVDKDSVGKAFIAYPNETCVHLHCKEDLSVCPKTGRSFADNLSVYCNALGGDSTD